MNAEEIREYALQKENVTESFPFGESSLVFKIFEKMFLLLSIDDIPLKCNLKCNPEKAEQLREQYPDDILPGYHMNKKHWNTVVVKNINHKLLKEMIDDSYALVKKNNKGL